jgi:hypothetical protein
MTPNQVAFIEGDQQRRSVMSIVTKNGSFPLNLWTPGYVKLLSASSHQWERRTPMWKF